MHYWNTFFKIAFIAASCLFSKCNIKRNDCIVHNSKKKNTSLTHPQFAVCYQWSSTLPDTTFMRQHFVITHLFFISSLCCFVLKSVKVIINALQYPSFSKMSTLAVKETKDFLSSHSAFNQVWIQISFEKAKWAIRTEGIRIRIKNKIK